MSNRGWRSPEARTDDGRGAAVELRRRVLLGSVLGSVALVLLAGCSAKHYQRSADKEVYGILQAYEQRIFGQTNEFRIDTRYSGRDPQMVSPEEIIEDRTAVGRRTLNLEQALDLAYERSREYQTQKEQLYLTALTLTGARYDFGSIFSASTAGQIAGTPAGSDVGSVASQVGVSQLLKTGGKLTVALGNDLVRYFTGKPDGAARNSAINTLSVNLSQPLLRGFGINDPSVENLTQSERNVVYSLRSFSLYEQQFAVDVVTSYFNLLTQRKVVRNNYRDYTNRVETTQYYAARARAGRLQQSDVDDALSQELSAKIGYINSVASYLTALDAFKTRLGLPISEDVYVDDADLQELMDVGLLGVDVNKESGFRICLERHMDVLNAIDRFEDSKRKVRVAADRLRAELSLFANASLSSEAPDDYVNFDPDKVRYTAGLRLNLPVDRLRERNTYRATVVSFESQIRSFGLTLDNFKDRIDRGLRSVEQARLNYLNAVESLKVAERRVDNNQLRLETGRATPRDLREAQDQLIRSQNTLALAYTAHLSARLDLLVDLGVMDTRPRKFWLTDPLKDQLTAGQRGAPPLRMPDDKVLPPETFLEPSS